MKNSIADHSSNDGKVEVALDPCPQARWKVVGGAQDDRWNKSVGAGLLNALPAAHLAERYDEAGNAAVAGLSNIKPADPIEGMIIGQMIAAHEAAFSLYSPCMESQPELRGSLKIPNARRQGCADDCCTF